MAEGMLMAKKEKSEALAMQFSYKNFVEYGKTLIGRIERNQLELARLCYRANQELGGQGKRNDLTPGNLSHAGQVVVPKTFRDFCEEIGLSKTTGYRYLAAYNAEEDRLYTKEEIKELAEKAWDELCADVHWHRANGEPDWAPNDRWGTSEELRYEQWLVDHGFAERKISDIAFHAPAFLDAYPVSGPFTFDFIDSIGRYCNEETRGEGAMRFYDMCQRYKKSVPTGIEPNMVLRIPVLVKGAIAQLPKEARKASTILVANILRDYVEDEV